MTKITQRRMAVGRIAMAACVALVSAAMFTGCDKKPKSTSTEGLAEIACDQSFERIMQQEIEVFEYIYPNASIMPYYVDEHAAIDSLMSLGSVKTAVTTRLLTDQEVKYLKDHRKNVKQHRIAVDAIALITNPANSFDEPVTRSELVEILTGKITRWGELGPSNQREKKIDVIFEHQGSSTVSYMRDSLLDGRDFGPNVYAQKTAEDVFKAVSENPGALGVIGVSWVSADLKGREVTTAELSQSLERNDTTNLDFNRAVNVLAVRNDSVITARKPYQAYIFDGSYPLYRSIYMITTAPNGSLGHGFYSFVTGFQGQKLIQMTGILPAIVRPRMVQVN